jgi:predicted Fe-Mo cluster-binding NifX family protein
LEVGVVLSPTDKHKKVIAVPSLSPGGLEAQRSAHFGHCDFFTLVEVDPDGATEVRVVENAPHHEGGCLNPVRLLASLGATEIVVGGMGARPLTYFSDLGITVYVDQQWPTVKEAVDALLEGSIPVMSPVQVCGGGNCR